MARGATSDSDLIEIIESFPGGVIPVYPLVEGVTQAIRCSTACGCCST